VDSENREGREGTPVRAEALFSTGDPWILIQLEGIFHYFMGC
jgi:hypothetical protein